jgi:integrase
MAAWARRAKTPDPTSATWARRLKLLRPFARYLKQFDPRTEVPDSTVFGHANLYLAPHIYREQEVVDLLAAAHRLEPDLRRATYEALFGLLASTGLRVSEAVKLKDVDADLKSGMLTVRETKFAKCRQVPLHPSTVEALGRYRALRNRHVSLTEETPFFFGSRGRRRGAALGLRQVHRIFQQLRDQMEWVNRGAHAAPRIHDLRHNSAFRIIPSTLADRQYLRGPSGELADLTRHNQRLFRKVNSSSSGRKRGSRAFEGVVLARASSFSSRSAWRYM